MTGYFYFLIAYAGPFILATLLFLLWAYISYRIRDRYPNYYKWSIKVYDSLPKAGAIIIIAAAIILFFTSESYNDWEPR